MTAYAFTFELMLNARLGYPMQVIQGKENKVSARSGVKNRRKLRTRPLFLASDTW